MPPCLWRSWRLSGLRGSSVLGLSSGLGVSSAWGSSVCWAWVVFCLGLCGASCCGSSEMSHAIPRHVFQTLKSHRWNCNVLGCCTKFGYPNCVRVLVEEAPKASSCVRSSSHDTVHNPRDASNTTPTPQNAKSHKMPTDGVHDPISNKLFRRRAPLAVRIPCLGPGPFTKARWASDHNRSYNPAITPQPGIQAGARPANQPGARPSHQPPRGR